MFSFWRKREEIVTIDDVIRSKYDPLNPKHSEFIKARLQAFQLALKKVQHIDQILIAGGSVDALLWCVGTFGTGVSLLLAIALVSYTLQYEKRNEHAQQLTKALTDLYAAYQWCAKDHTMAISQDPHFLAILTQLAPYVTSNELVLWDLKTQDGSQLSQEFIKVLSQSPHCVQFIGVYRQGQPKEDPSLLAFGKDLLMTGTEAGLQNQILNRVTNYMETNKYLHLFGQSVAEAKFALYGKAPSEETVVPSMRP